MPEAADTARDASIKNETPHVRPAIGDQRAFLTLPVLFGDTKGWADHFVWSAEHCS